MFRVLVYYVSGIINIVSHNPEYLKNHLLCLHSNYHCYIVLLLHRYGLGTELLFDQKFAVLVCGGNGPHICKAIIQKFLQYRRASACNCG